MYEWNFEPVLRQKGLLIEGVLGTLQLSASALAIAIPFGLVLALMRLSKNGVAAHTGTAAVYILRSSALMVMIFWTYSRCQLSSVIQYRRSSPQRWRLEFRTRAILRNCFEAASFRYRPANMRLPEALA